MNQCIWDSEWREIVAIPKVREGWGLAEDESVDDFKSTVYGVKFDYITGGPGYFGDLYLIQDDALQSPLALSVETEPWNFSPDDCGIQLRRTRAQLRTSSDASAANRA